MNAEERRQQRMRGAGTHLIHEKAVEFPPASPSITVTDIAIPSSASTSGRKKDDSRMDIEDRNDESEVDLSILAERRSMSSYEVAPSGNKRRQERMRGAGTHQIEVYNAHFASPAESVAPSSSLRSAGHTMPDSDTPRSKRARLDRKSPSRLAVNHRQERMRGAGTHIIDPQLIPFASPSGQLSTLTASPPPVPSHESVLTAFPSKDKGVVQKPQSYNNEAAQDGPVIPSLEQRTQQRMRGAGTHAIQRKHVDFPDASPSALSASPSGFNVDLHGQGEDAVADAPLQFDLFVDDNDDIVRTDASSLDVKSERHSQSHKDALYTPESPPPPPPLEELPVETLVRLVKVPHPKQHINMATVPMWLIPRQSRSKREQEKALRDSAEVTTLAESLFPGRAGESFRINDADVTFTLIKREMASFLMTGKDKGLTETFERILARLFPLFRNLSEQASVRQRLAHQFRVAQVKLRDMQRSVYKKRAEVLRVKRSVEKIRREHTAQKQRIQHTDDVDLFLNELRTMSAGWTS